MAAASGSAKGLPVRLDERRGVTWSADAATGNAVRSAPREGVREIETCARCHARRGQFNDDGVHGRPLGDSFRVALLDNGLYWNDGQQRDEVYNHGSFLQSKMFAKGVTCSDCHDPHSLKLRAPGNAGVARSATCPPSTMGRSTASTRPARRARSVSHATCRRRPTW